VAVTPVAATVSWTLTDGLSSARGAQESFKAGFRPDQDEDDDNDDDRAALNKRLAIR